MQNSLRDGKSTCRLHRHSGRPTVFQLRYQTGLLSGTENLSSVITPKSVCDRFTQENAPVPASSLQKILRPCRQPPTYLRGNDENTPSPSPILKFPSQRLHCACKTFPSAFSYKDNQSRGCHSQSIRFSVHRRMFYMLICYCSLSVQTAAAVII